MNLKKDVIIIGAGAAGLMTAVEAGKRGRSVIVLERSEKIGNKIRISGGGRCNFTNIYSTSENFISQNPHFCKSALARFTPHDFIALVEKHGISYNEKKLGQLFCDKGSDEIIRLFENECRFAEVEIRVNCEVLEITKNNFFKVHTVGGIFEASSLVIATGGLSIPKMGATSFGYQIAKQFGIHMIACKPALVPFTWNQEDLKIFGGLAGVSLDAIVSYGKQKFRENILFTHRGLSGPAILQISTYWENEKPIAIDLLPGREIFDEFVIERKKKTDFSHLLNRYLPRRFVQILCDRKFGSKTLNLYTEKELKIIAEQLHKWIVTPGGTEGYEKAEVTNGGVDTAECFSKTMESRKVPGLYFVGEVMDVTGHLGGHNFQWAWSSGFAAGLSV